MKSGNRILAVDDNPDNLLVLRELLEDKYEMRCAVNGAEALNMVSSFQPDLILLDVAMPGMSGIETCHRLQTLAIEKQPKVVFVSARYRLEDRLAGYEAGAIDYLGKPFNHDEVCAKVASWAKLVRKEELEGIWREAELARTTIGTSMLSLASFRDTETGDHLLRVRKYAQLLAECIGNNSPYSAQIDTTFLKHLWLSTPLHDIGKVAIPDAILQKPGRLTRDEFEIMKTHSSIGGNLLRLAAQRLPSPGYLNMAADIAHHHHERFDGTGYPDRLAGTEIPLAARILCVADVFDALTSKRVYKAPISVAQATEVILEESGEQFDPTIIVAFKHCLDDLNDVHRRYHLDHELSDSDLSTAGQVADCPS